MNFCAIQKEIERVHKLHEHGECNLFNELTSSICLLVASAGGSIEADIRKDLLSGSSSRPLGDVQALLLGFLANMHAKPL